MNRTILRHVLPLSIAFLLAGCAATDDPSASDDAITPQEIAEGDAWEAAGQNEHGDEHASGPVGPDLGLDTADQPDEELADEASVDSPAVDSTPFLDPEELALPPEGIVPGDPDASAFNETKACHAATGYRKGKAFTICITKVDGKWVEVNTARAYLRMRTAARKGGVKLYVVSGFRTMAKQRYLYKCYKTKKCNNGNLAAPPGYSNHQSGKALDLNTSARGVYSFLSKRGKSYGFRRTVPSEKWHWEH